MQISSKIHFRTTADQDFNIPHTPTTLTKVISKNVNDYDEKEDAYLILEMEFMLLLLLLNPHNKLGLLCTLCLFAPSPCLNKASGVWAIWCWWIYILDRYQFSIRRYRGTSIVLNSCFPYVPIILHSLVYIFQYNTKPKHTKLITGYPCRIWTPKSAIPSDLLALF